MLVGLALLLDHGFNDNHVAIVIAVPKEGVADDHIHIPRILSKLLCNTREHAVSLAIHTNYTETILAVIIQLH